MDGGNIDLEKGIGYNRRRHDFKVAGSVYSRHMDGGNIDLEKGIGIHKVMWLVDCHIFRLKSPR